MVGLGEHLYNRMRQAPKITAVLAGANEHVTVAETEFDTITDALSDAGARVHTEKWSRDQYDREDVHAQDAMSAPYGSLPGVSMLYVNDASMWADEHASDPIEGYQRILELTEDSGLDAVLFADVDADFERYNADPDLMKGRIAAHHPTYTFQEYDGKHSLLYAGTPFDAAYGQKALEASAD